MMIDIVFFGFLIISAFTDIVYRKVFNAVTFPAVILGLGLNCIYRGMPGLKESLLGCGAGFLLLFLFYIVGGMGAGDVKFLMAVGSLKGFSFLLMGSLYGAVIGGVTALFFLIAQRRFSPVVRNVVVSLLCYITFQTKESLQFDTRGSTCLPYAALLSLGMCLAFLKPSW